jgi:DNA-binding transcriptional LysR family regulator
MGQKKAALSGQLADIDLRLLRVFKAVVDAGGFTPAEIGLNLANSTISNYISDLEKRLDMRLCNRGRAGFSITEQGQVVYNASIELLQAIDDFRNKVNQSHDRLLGQIKIGFAEHMLGGHDSCIVEAIEAFSKLAPDVHINISTLSADEVYSAVFDKKIDLGITVVPQRISELEVLPLFDEEMFLYCGQQHPLYAKNDNEITREELQHYKFVESPRLLPGREAHEDMKLWNKQAQAHHQEARATLIMSGQYLGILPLHLVENWGLKNKMRPLFKDVYGYQNTFSALVRKNRINEKIVQLFFDCLKNSIKK